MSGYLNIAEVESAIANLAGAHPSLCRLIAMPNQTYEQAQAGSGVVSHALSISAAPTGTVDAVLILGGVHAREWGSCEILINLATDLITAYLAGAGLSYGPVTIAASTVAQIIEQRELVLFPLVNPDGRAYSQANDQNNLNGWRKNRNPASSGGDAAKIGVDVNRNYDFLWNFDVDFSPAAYSGASANFLASDDPSNDVFHGQHPFSEPENQNVKWLADQFPRVRWFLDAHSYSQLMMYSWGDSPDQSSNPSENFQNAAYNGMRGTTTYGEYVPADDEKTASVLAQALVATTSAVNGNIYQAEQDFSLYATSGASDDYMYSRSWVDPALTKVLAFTLEWGKEFHPLWPMMEPIITEVTAGLIVFCAGTFVPPAVSFELDRDHFGEDEIDALRTQPGGAVVKTAFWVTVDGFTARQLGIAGSGSTNIGPLVALNPSTGLSTSCTSVESTDANFSPDAFQRFRFGYDVNFGTTDAAFSFAGQTEHVTLTTSFQGIAASAQVTLMKQPNPYIRQGAVDWWLSSDIRVIQIQRDQTQFGVTMKTDPQKFLSDLTAALTTGQGVAGGQSFDDNTTEQNEILTVAPYAQVGFEKVPVYNFAVARVHYAGEFDPAKDVRVFFRLFAANSTSTEFEADTYARWPATYPVPPAKWDEHTVPTPGVWDGEYVTIPCFAEPRQPANGTGAPNSLPSQQFDTANVQTLQPTGSGPVRDYFYGAFLDINQSTGVFPSGGVVPAGNAEGPWPSGSGVSLEPVSAAFVRNEHQCLAAEIAFDPDSIAYGTPPWNSDKLAQRNLSWSTVANPGIAVSRQALETFEVRPTPATVAAGATPDELMIDWTGVPAGEQAQIYLPAVDASAVLAQVADLYPNPRLTLVDAHTIGCRTGGVTYIPLPGAGAGGAKFAGLLSIALPAGIRAGEQYQVVVRQLTSASAVARGRDGADEADAAEILHWRRVLGIFQVNIPVSTKEAMLPTEELRYSIFQWIGASIPPASRWHPVFQRYLGLLGTRVGELGGNPAQIAPSQDGYSGLPHGPHGPHGHGWTGKVVAIFYDHFGDFDGFGLELENGHEHRFRSHAGRVEHIVREAWRDEILTTVISEPHDAEAVRFVILRR
jgi:murein tripeptide amidase MpaA